MVNNLLFDVNFNTGCFSCNYDCKTETMKLPKICYTFLPNRWVCRKIKCHLFNEDEYRVKCNYDCCFLHFNSTLFKEPNIVDFNNGWDENG